MDKIPLTASGFARLEKELKHLRSVERPAVIEAIAEARAHGDLKENAEYAAAKEKQGFIEGRILELEATISRADIIDIASLTGHIVKFGATVTIIDEETEDSLTYQIVGDLEADITKGRIAMSAPIARAIIGKAKGTSVEVNTPKGIKFYEILEVDFVEVEFV